MQSENRILGNQLVVMSREDLDALVNEMAQNIVAAQTKNAQNDYEAWMSVPEGERFITREDVCKKLFKEIAPTYSERNGGYTRIVRTGVRRGDAAETAVIELVR